MPDSNGAFALDDARNTANVAANRLPQFDPAMEAAADIIGLAASLVLVWYGTIMTAQSARLGSITIKNLVFPEWWLLWPLPFCFVLVALEFVFRFHRLMGAPRTRVWSGGSCAVRNRERMSK